MMPDINGFELIPIIRSYAEHKDTPVIFLTSIGTIDNVTAAIALGASDFIVKPFNPESLREKVSKHIVRKKLF
jgi:DNA-binding response OmpR family regulator